MSNPSALGRIEWPGISLSVFQSMQASYVASRSSFCYVTTRGYYYNKLNSNCMKSSKKDSYISIQTQGPKHSTKGKGSNHRDAFSIWSMSRHFLFPHKHCHPQANQNPWQCPNIKIKKERTPERIWFNPRQNEESFFAETCELANGLQITMYREQKGVPLGARPPAAPFPAHQKFKFLLQKLLILQIRLHFRRILRRCRHH